MANLQGSVEATNYQTILIELCEGLVNHGFGELKVEVRSLADGSVRLIILCGKSYFYIVKKEIKFDKMNFL